MNDPAMKTNFGAGAPLREALTGNSAPDQQEIPRLLRTSLSRPPQRQRLVHRFSEARRRRVYASRLGFVE